MGTKLKQGDSVVVITGKDKAKHNVIQKVNIKSGTVVVKELNVVKLHKKPQKDFQGGIIERPNPIRISNVMFECKRCKAGVRLKYRKLEDGKKIRVCSKCKESVD